MLCWGNGPLSLPTATATERSEVTKVTTKATFLDTIPTYFNIGFEFSAKATFFVRMCSCSMRGGLLQDLRVCLSGEILSADTSILNFEVLIGLKILKSNAVEQCRTLVLYCRNMFPKFDARLLDASRPTEVA